MPLYRSMHVVQIAEGKQSDVHCVLRHLKPEAFFVNRLDAPPNTAGMRFDTEREALDFFRSFENTPATLSLD